MNNLLQKPALWVAIILVFAAFFRIFFLDLIEFKYDEAFTVFQMVQFYSHPYLVQTGPIQSTGVYNPPLYNYLMILISFLSRDPQYLSFVIAFINSASIAIFYLVIRKFFGNLTALSSALILALTPWSIIFSRKIWIPDLILPFMVVFLYFLLDLFIKKKVKATLPVFLVLALLVQMHASGLFFAVTTILILLINREKINWKKALIGFSIGLIPALPYFARQLFSTPFCIDCVAFLNYQAISRPFDWNVFIRPFQLTGGLNFEALLGFDFELFLQSNSFLKYSSFLFLAGFIIPLFGMFYIILNKRQYVYLPLYLLIVPVLYFLTRTPSYMHYFAILTPIIALFYGLSLSFLWDLFKSSFMKAIVLAAFLIILITNFIYMYSFNMFLSKKPVINGDYGPVFPKTKEFVEQQTMEYRFLKDYDLIKSYFYMFARDSTTSAKLKDLLIQKGNP